METIITFTPAQLIGGVIAICGAVTAVAAVITIFVKIVNKAKEPKQHQDERIDALEADVSTLKQWAANDKKAISEIEEGTRVTQTAILALLSHAIDGNNTEELRKAKASLNDYLIKK